MRRNDEHGCEENRGVIDKDEIFFVDIHAIDGFCNTFVSSWEL